MGIPRRGPNGSNPAVRCICLVAIGWASVANGQLHFETYRGYFLVGQFGEVCTTCEAAVLCEQGVTPPKHGAIPDAGDFTVFHLQTRSFWSQISTIWELILAAVDEQRLASRGHTRPVHVYHVEAGTWSTPTVTEARLRLEPAVLEFGPIRIDRLTKAWRRGNDNSVSGFCENLPLWDALEAIDARAPRAPG